MNRRGFLGSILALAAAPAIVRADSLMRVVPVDSPLILPFADGYREQFIMQFNQSRGTFLDNVFGQWSKGDVFILKPRAAAMYQMTVVNDAASFSADDWRKL